MIVHATAIARRVQGTWRAALLFGPSGSGKSDLALRALDRGWRLVADDYAVLWASDGRLWVRAPEAIAGRMEARHLGILEERQPVLLAEALFAVRCAVDPIERLPEAETMTLEVGELPLVALSALEPSAAAKLDRVLSTRVLGGASGSAYWTRSRGRTTVETGGPGRDGGLQEA